MWAVLKGLNHNRPINGTVLNRLSWRHYFKTPFLKQVHRPVSSLNIINHKSIPQQPFKLSHLKTYLISRAKHTKHFHKAGIKVNMEIIKVDNAANRIHSTPIHLMHHINSSDINNFMKIQG